MVISLQRLAFGLLILLMPAGYSVAQAYTPDLSMSLAQFQDQALKPKEEVWVVDFWATWCGPCVMSIPHMKEVQAKYAPKGVRFISVSWDRNEYQWKAGLERFEMPWQHIFVPKGQEDWLEENFPHRGIPTVFIVQRSGKAKKVADVYEIEKPLDKAIAH